jgi:predicted RNA-binding protein YlqC (UPF0109 family)
MDEAQLEEIRELVQDMIDYMFPNEEDSVSTVSFVRGERMVEFIVKVRDAKIAAQVIGKEGSVILPIRSYVKNLGRFNKMYFGIEVVVKEVDSSTFQP